MVSSSLATVGGVPPKRNRRRLTAVAVAAEPPLLEGTRAQLPLTSMSPLRYPGSKRKMVPAIRQLIDANEPPPKLLVEPFCGGASVSLGLLAQDAVERVMLADFDPLVAAFWHKATNGETLVKEMRKLEVTVEEWDRSRTMRPRCNRSNALKCLFLKAARVLVHALASAVAADTNEALRRGYGHQLRVMTDFVADRGPCDGRRATGSNRGSP